MISVILLDDKTDRHTELARLLEGSGNFEVIALPSHEHAIERCRTGSVDAVIVRHEEPGQDGLAVLTILESQAPELPVIFLSGMDAPHFASGARAHHAHFIHLPEPIASSYPALEQVIGLAVDLHHAKQRVAFLQKKLELVGSVTRHDVLNQLTAVNGYNELLLMMIKDPTMESYLEKVKNAVDKIRIQFQYAKVYQNLGIEPPRFQQCCSVVQQAGESVNLKTIRVINTCGDANICADPLFEKAFTYLFENVIQADENVTEIRIFIEEKGAGAVLVFEDNGTGVPAPDKERIFGRGFGQNHRWGLFLTREILAVTGITIAENGEPGKGTRFEMQIPSGRYRRESEKSPL
jgi:signal transduction histidine kinase